MDPAAASAPSDLEALTQFLYMAPIGLVQATIDGDIAMINPMSAQLLLPLSRDGELVNLFEVIGDICPDLRHRAQSYPAEHGKVCDDLHLDIPATAPRREPQVFSLTLLKLDSHRLMAVLSDVTVSVRRERALRQSQAWIDTIIAGVTDYALTSLDRDGRVQCWNASVGRVTGFSADRSVGQPYSMFYPEEAALSGARLLDRLYEAQRDGWSLDEGWLLRADGTRFWGSCLIAPLDLADAPCSDEPAFSLIIRDISERKGASDALRQSVSCDHLTGLSNRRAFFETALRELQRWQRMPRPMSLVLIDADRFKAVNDRHGHAAGDAVLRHLAAALCATFRGMDVIARVGGEEFAILMPGTAAEGAHASAARLCQLIESQTVEFDGATIRYTVSAGTATMETGIDSVEELMKRADTAMYVAKASGRNRVVGWTGDIAAGPGPQPHAAERLP